jgi:hypothetical protein
MVKDMRFIRLLWIAAFCVPLSSWRSIAAQDATVVFYSHGSVWATGVPLTDNGIFGGSIYDGDRKLFTFRDSYFVHNNRTLILHLPAGPHVFSARWSDHPSRKTLSLTLEPGQVYFLRAQSESRGFIEVEWERGRLDQVTCAVATEETKNAKVIRDKGISKATFRNVSKDQALPACP